MILPIELCCSTIVIMIYAIGVYFLSLCIHLLFFSLRLTQREETRETSAEHAPVTLSLMEPSTTSTKKHGNLCVIKDSEKEQILNTCHAAPTSCHFGINKTTEKITTWYFWPSQCNDIQDFIGRCDKCQRSNWLQKTPAVLHPVPPLAMLSFLQWAKLREAGGMAIDTSLCSLTI